MANVLLGAPCGTGPAWSPKTAIAIVQSSKNHTVSLVASIGSWSNFDILWSMALNKGRLKEIDYFVMLHGDIELQPGWVDTLIEVIEEKQADLVSAIVPQKAVSGITSSGIGDPSDPWQPHKRFTMNEVWAEGAPETFDADDCGYPGKYILHNNGCWIARLSCEKFYATEIRDGREFALCCFDFPRSIQVIDGEYAARGESEDWFFSRKIHELGVKSYITRKLALSHVGSIEFQNDHAWGSEQVDEATKEKWGKAI